MRTVSDEIDHYMLSNATTWSRETMTWYGRRLDPLRQIDKPIVRVTADDLNSIFNDLATRGQRYTNHHYHQPEAGGLSPATLRGYVRAWKSFFNWLLDCDAIVSSPARRLRLPRVEQGMPKAITESDMLRLLDAAKASSARDYAIVSILADTACRAGAVISMTLDNIDLDNRLAVVIEKGDRKRYIPFTADTAEAIRAYMVERPDADSRQLFVGRRGPLKRNAINQILRRLAKTAGVNGRVNPHSFRHGWVKGALARGAKLSDASHVLGHTSIATTFDFYDVWDVKDLQRQHDRYTWRPRGTE